MLLRLAGAVAVLLASAALGFYCGVRETFRVRDLMEFKKALVILASEIEYMRAPLPAACANIAGRVVGPISVIWSHFSDLLTKNKGETAYQLWVQAIDSQKEDTYFAPEDIEILDGFGKTLGYLDKKMQLNAINYAADYIDEKAAVLKASENKNKRMYRSLGIIGGFLLAVILW